MAKSKTSFTEGNQAALKHGGAAAYRAIAQKKEFTGLARETEKAIEDDLHSNGSKAMLAKDCIRLHTAAELYWGHILGAIEAGDMPRFESYVKTYGWLATAGARLLGQLAALEGKESANEAIEIIKKYRDNPDQSGAKDA